MKSFLTTTKNLRILFSFISFSFSVISLSATTLHTPIAQNQSLIQTERGLEIRYIILTDKIAKEKNEIIVEGVKYFLFKTKEAAIENIKYASPKKDYTIVYVLTEKKKNTEIIAIPAESN